MIPIEEADRRVAERSHGESSAVLRAATTGFSDWVEAHARQLDEDDGVLVLRPFNFDPDAQFEVRLFTDVPGAIQCEFIEFLPLGFEPSGIQYGAVTRGVGVGVRIDDYFGMDAVCFANVAGTLVPGACLADCPADLAEPFGTLDFTDILAFLTSFNAGCP